MTTQTKINKRGLPVFERLIQSGCVTFAETAETAQPDITRVIEEVARILLEQRLENDRTPTPYRGSGPIVSTEEYMEWRRCRHRNKCNRIAAARQLLLPLLDSTCSDWQEKFIGGFLAETFMLESDYQSAFFWLAVSYPSPHYRAPANLNEARSKVSGFGVYLPRVLKTQAWRYEEPINNSSF